MVLNIKCYSKNEIETHIHVGSDGFFLNLNFYDFIK